MDLNVNAFKIYHEEWALLTSGTEENFNTMTISWGGLGTLWSKPVATVYVKPVRYTHQFMENNDYFTVSFYAEEYKRALMILGSKSGRDEDKVAVSKLTPEFLDHAVTFKEAKLTLLCKKIYHQDMDMKYMPDDVITDYYTTELPHTMYIGEVIDMDRL